MRQFIQDRKRRTVMIFFGSIYSLALMMAIFPPFYLPASGIDTVVLGLPFSILYWILDVLILGLGIWAFYVVEDIRGELDEALPSADEATGE